VQELCNERFYSRPATAERLDGSRPTLMDTLYNICPAAFGPVECPLSAESVQPQEHATLVCNSQLETPPAADQQDMPDLSASMRNDSEGTSDGNSAVAATAASKPHAADIAGTQHQSHVEAALEPPDCKDRSFIVRGSEPLEDVCDDWDQHPQVREDLNKAVSSGVGDMKETKLAGAVCESAETGEADEGDIETQGLEPDVEDGGGSVTDQAAASDSGAAAAIRVAPDSTADLSREENLQTPQQERGVVGVPVKAGLCPPRVLSGCLREGVEVEVAGVRAQPPGGSGELLQASLLELHELLHAPDLFLYIVVHMPPELCT
jgi:hypothetical protein